MSTKQKTVVGIIWNSIELSFGYIIQFIVTIILARLLTPNDFGILGLLTIFTLLSQVIVDSGFAQALIRKIDADQKDYSSIFYFNIVLGLFLYLVLFFCSPLISDFYNYSELTIISRVSFLTILINSFGIVQDAKIRKEVKFKVLAKRTILANALAGLIAIIMAFYGFGIWALVFQMLTSSFFKVLFVWMLSKWTPSWEFSIKPVSSMMKFSLNIMISNFVDVIASNIQTLVIGKYYTKQDLGFYSQAKNIQNAPTNIITQSISKVSYSTLSPQQNEIEKLRENFKRVINIAMYISLPIMLFLFTVADNFIIGLLGEKWKPAVPYFRLLCINGAIFPFYTLGMNLFMIIGKSKLYLNISIVKRCIAIACVIITVNFGVYVIICGRVVAAIINSIITMIYSGKLIKYSFFEQIRNSSSSFFATLLMMIIVYFIGEFLNELNSISVISVQFIVAIIVYSGISKLMNISSYMEIEKIILSFINKKDRNESSF